MKNNFEKTPLSASLPRKSEALSYKMELMQESHAQAIAAYNLEKLISLREEINLSAPEIQTELDKLRPNIRERFKLIIQSYGLMRRESLERFLKLRKAVLEETKGTQMDFGSRVFEKYIGHRPRGLVTLVHDEAYLIMCCEDPEDYGEANAGPGKPIDKRRTELSGGSFHKVVVWPIRNRNSLKKIIPLILVKGHQTSGATIAHERQHFINHKLLGFWGKPLVNSEFQSAAYSDAAEARDARDIKDEVLAFIRDGIPGARLEESLNSELYAHLFSRMQEDKQKKIKKIINEVGVFLDGHSRLFVGEEARAILVYQLIGIPMERFPKWLTAFEKYYGERLELEKLFDRVDMGDMLHNPENPLASGDTYPDRFQIPEKIEVMRQKVRELQGLRLTAQNKIYDLGKDLKTVRAEIEALAAEYKKLYQELQKNLLPLQAFPPHAYLDEGSSLRDLPLSDIGKSEEKHAEYVMRAVLNAVLDFPQQDIDSIIDALERDLSAEPPAEKKLSELIKNVINQNNPGHERDIRIGLGPSYLYKKSLSARIEFEVTASGKRKLGGGEAFDLYLHSSKFSI